MKKILFSISFLFALLFLPSFIYAQVVLSGQLRPRAEYSHGYRSLANENQDPSLFVSQRTRLNFAFSKAKIKTYFSLQDVRVWGNQPQLVANQDYAISIHQAWAEVLFTEKLGLRVGRQELVYDDSRLLGNVGWAQQARTHDLALLKFEDKCKIHLGIAYNENTERNNNFYYGPDAYKTMQFVWFNRQFNKFGLSVLLLNNGLPFNIYEEGDTENEIILKEQKIRFSQTIGTHLKFKATEKLALTANIYYQGGKTVVQNMEYSISGLNAALDIAYKISNVKWNLGIESLSGTDYDVNDKTNSFNPLFGTNHKFNGFMDYFYVGNHINNVGLNDVYLKGMWGKGKIKAGAHLHAFMTAAKLSADSDSYLGTELDITFIYKIGQNIAMQAGYSQLFATDAMVSIKGGSKKATQNWAYLQLNFTPEFFNSSNK